VPVDYKHKDIVFPINMTEEPIIHVNKDKLKNNNDVRKNTGSTIINEIEDNYKTATNNNITTITRYYTRRRKLVSICGIIKKYSKRQLI
jgi:hypothetical protein